MDFIKAGKKIYSQLVDEKSKEIFEDRILYSLTDDVRYIRKMIENNVDDGERFKNILLNKKKTYIFGAGIWGREIARIWGDRVCAFVDNDARKISEGNSIYGLPIMNSEILKENKEDKQVIIGTRLFCDEIYSQLKKMGLTDNEIINAGKMLDDLSKKEYFDLGNLPRNDNEVFADVGCLDGMSTLRFFQWSGSKESKAICFEPDKKNIPKCKDNLGKYIDEKRVDIVSKGAWSDKKTLRFVSKGNGGSSITENSEENDELVEIDTITIDEVLENRPITYIKMDIEGAEFEALKGCEKTIREQKPKLAICVYHKPEDIFELPNLILNFNPEYKLYLRHYSIAAAETVLYAIP